MAVIVGALVYVLQSRYAELQDAIRNSSHDLVTGTGNRRAAMDNLDWAMQQSQTNGQQFAVLMVDVRQLHRVNASLGRSGGDQALLEIARRLQEGLRKQDMLARLESDKFLIVMPPQTDTARAYGTAMSLSTRFERPIRVHGVEVAVQIATSVVVGPGDHADAGELLDAAEAALLHVKKKGFQSGGEAQAALVSSRDALQFESELRLAAGKDEFRLHLQPQFSLRDGSLIGAEALVRWQHPYLGLLPPGKFIPIAEAAGFIPDITAAVIQNACRMQRELADAALPELNLSINFSAVDLAMTESLERLRMAMQKAGIPGSQLSVEITESGLMRDPAMAQRVLTRLRAMGVQAAIDDFGTGHSSLNYLNRFPVDLLKVDRSFVSGVSDDERGIALLRAINDMAHAMGLQTLAEGVETTADHALLAELGFDSAQGFLYSPPLPLDEFLEQHLDPETRRWISYPGAAASRP
nr:bifunctional diguanylate cyclase/phosphodiesterase [Methylonatrum kenyense]